MYSLHLNELPFRHIFQKLDGSTSGPRSFLENLDQQMNGNVKVLSVANFKPIRNEEFPNLFDKVIGPLSSNQYYALQMCKAVISGDVDEDL